MTCAEDLDVMCKQFNFSARLINVLTLIAPAYNIFAIYNIGLFPHDSGYPSNEILLKIHEPSSGRLIKKYFINVSNGFDSLEYKEICDNLATQIENDFLYSTQLISNTLNPTLGITTNDTIATFITSRQPNTNTLESSLSKIQEEISSRGDFVLDIPKFVDALFKLGVIKAKED